jgi:hypothetical protein
MIKLQQDEYSKYDVTDTFVDYDRMFEVDYKPTNKNMLIKILKFLDGKKNILQAVVAVTATYLADKAFIGTIDAVYIVTVSGIVFGTASIATTQYLYSDK